MRLLLDCEEGQRRGGGMKQAANVTEKLLFLFILLLSNKVLLNLKVVCCDPYSVLVYKHILNNLIKL